ncbi:MAG: hypothetical protein BWY67_00301 [Bacteroidetes bacterium ADurb.Bin397]|nr:MAG: hypothetical protein BWY67_00301 [Bacteroidetes bacterium ADurb.Bin397]
MLFEVIGKPNCQFGVIPPGFNPPPFNMVSPVALAIQIPLLAIKRLPFESLMLACVPQNDIFRYSEMNVSELVSNKPLPFGKFIKGLLPSNH